MTKVVIYIYDEPSAKNKKLMKFLNSKVTTLKKTLKISAVRITERQRKKLPPELSKLPAMQFGEQVINGCSNIINKLENFSNTKQENRPMSEDPLYNFQMREMMSKEDNEPKNNDDVMEKKFAEVSKKRDNAKVQQKPQKQNAMPVGGGTTQMPEQSISSMANDPLMRNFWANQEETLL